MKKKTSIHPNSIAPRRSMKIRRCVVVCGVGENRTMMIIEGWEKIRVRSRKMMMKKKKKSTTWRTRHHATGALFFVIYFFTLQTCKAASTLKQEEREEEEEETYHSASIATTIRASTQQHQTHTYAHTFIPMHLHTDTAEEHSLAQGQNRGKGDKKEDCVASIKIEE